jgi:hypothetical protein
MDWISTHWIEIGVIALAAHTLLKAIADVTTTKKDDAIVAKIGSIIGYFFGKRPQ